MKQELVVSDIQHFSLGDGEGIRTTVFLKGCPLRCPWCHNPETQMREPQTLHYRANGKSVLYGKMMTAEEIYGEVIADKPFYEESGGGVTISGGEPLTQPEGVAQLSRILCENGVSVLIDTAGDVPFSVFEKILPYVDTYYIDLKTADRETYKTVIGADCDRICANIRKLTSLGKCVHVRIPLIPGFNDAPEQSAALCELIGTLGTDRVDLLPFHRLGVSKYEALGREYAYRNTEPLTKAQTEKIADRFRTKFQVTVEY